MRMTKRLLFALGLGIASCLVMRATVPEYFGECLYSMLAAVLYLEATR